MAITFDPLQLPYAKSEAPKTEGLSGDQIKDYIIQRMTAGVKGYDADGLDTQMLSMGLTPMFGGDEDNSFSSPTSNLSSLLNRHFHLNTLPMLNKGELGHILSRAIEPWKLRL